MSYTVHRRQDTDGEVTRMRVPVVERMPAEPEWAFEVRQVGAPFRLFDRIRAGLLGDKPTRRGEVILRNAAGVDVARAWAKGFQSTTKKRPGS